MHRINNRKTRVERILALLIESGVIYFLFFVRAPTSFVSLRTERCLLAGSGCNGHR